MKYIFILLLLIINSFAQDVDIDVNINEDLSTKNIGFFQFTFTNNTEDWQTFKNPKVSFGTEADKNIKILNAVELEAYFEYLNQIQTDSSSNKGMVSMALSWINPLASLATLPNSSAEMLDGDGIKYPKGYLFGKDILIPPGVKLKRFMIISSKNHSTFGFLNSLKIYNKELIFRDSQMIERDNPLGGSKLKSKRIYTWQSDL